MGRQGHIALDRAVFPNGTTGYQLDTLARAELWKHGLGPLKHTIARTVLTACSHEQTTSMAQDTEW